MSIRLPQNPGIGDLDELTDAELILVQNIASLGDPNADRILFWDDSASSYQYLRVGSGLSITGTTLSATGDGTVGGSGTTNELAYWVDASTLGALAVATYPSLTEISYVKGVSSGIQSQLNGKQATITFGTGVLAALGVNIGSAGAPVLFNGALGTPTSGTLSNASGLPVSGIVSSTTQALGLGSIELGHASDTTISRVSAGIIAVEGVNIPTVSSTDTLSNKTLTAPKFANGGFIADANGNEEIIFTTTASAVNEITVANAATGNAPSITATGGDTNIDLNIGAKGTGLIKETTARYQDVVTATDGATVTFDLSDGNYQKVTLGGNRTLALSNVKVGQFFVLDLVQDATGSRTVTWFTTIKWAGGAAPTLTTTASKIDTLGFVCTSSGNYQGYVIGQNL